MKVQSCCFYCERYYGWRFISQHFSRAQEMLKTFLEMLNGFSYFLGKQPVTGNKK